MHNDDEYIDFDASDPRDSHIDADPSDTGGNTTTPTPGLAQIEGAITFTNDQVLKPDATTAIHTSELMVDQAAAMMIQDVQSFMQGNEQLLMMATAKALALLVNPATQDKGKTALQEITTFTATLPVFATAMGVSAAGIVTAFDAAT